MSSFTRDFPVDPKARIMETDSGWLRLLVKMEEISEEERILIANDIQKTNKTKAFLLYLAFVIMPVAICQHWVFAGILSLLAAVYLAINPDFGRPTRPELNEIIETEMDFSPPIQAVCQSHKHKGLENLPNTLTSEAGPKELVLPKPATHIVQDHSS